jgi:hypothetical protein
LLAARDELSSAAGAVSGGSQQQIEFLKRVITRDPSKCTDLEIPVTLEEFKQVCGRSVGRSVGRLEEGGDRYPTTPFKSHAHHCLLTLLC